MPRCATSDLDGIASLSSLRELYLAYNDIVDISPCSLLEHIQILDLEGSVIRIESYISLVRIISPLCRASPILIKFNLICIVSVKEPYIREYK